MNRGRPSLSTTGFTVIEALVSLLVGLLIGTLALGTFARQRTLQNSLARRGDALSALRTARYVLGREVRTGDGTERVGRDTLGLRAFRGVAMICPTDRGLDGTVRVRVEGVRAPDLEKDSVWLPRDAGAAQVLALVDRGPARAPCPDAPAEAVETWQLSGPVPAGARIARYFERGSYHLTEGALRYRRGQAGRQPLTPEVLLTPPSGFQAERGLILVDIYIRDPEHLATLAFPRSGPVVSSPR